MLKVENVAVTGFEAAIRGMRNPMNSWERSDSDFSDGVRLGEADLRLARVLGRGSSDDGKFLRMIHVSMDVTAPLFWWKEADQYKVGTTTDSCSTMHRIHARDLCPDDFSFESLEDAALDAAMACVAAVNDARRRFVESGKKDKGAWREMIELLPSAYNQRRTWDMNYEVARSIYRARRNHKLYEWHVLCDEIAGLPYFKELFLDD